MKLFIINFLKQKNMCCQLNPIVLSKLNQYREHSNLDRFILPEGENIKLFADVIDKVFNFLIKNLFQ